MRTSCVFTVANSVSTGFDDFLFSTFSSLSRVLYVELPWMSLKLFSARRRMSLSWRIRRGSSRRSGMAVQSLFFHHEQFLDSFTISLRLYRFILSNSQAIFLQICLVPLADGVRAAGEFVRERGQFFIFANSSVLWCFITDKYCSKPARMSNRKFSVAAVVESSLRAPGGCFAGASVAGYCFVSVWFLSGFARAGPFQELRSRFTRLSVSSCVLFSASPAVFGEWSILAGYCSLHWNVFQVVSHSHSFVELCYLLSFPLAVEGGRRLLSSATPFSGVFL